MSHMFENARSFSSDLNWWKVKDVENVVAQFKGATSFAGSLEGWKLERVADFTSQFEGAESFNSDVSRWKMKSAVRLDRMFKNARSFNQDLDDWDKLDNVVSMNEMFLGASSFNQTICWNKLNDNLEMQNMFHWSLGCFDLDCVNEDLLPYFDCSHASPEPITPAASSTVSPTTNTDVGPPVTLVVPPTNQTSDIDMDNQEDPMATILPMDVTPGSGTAPPNLVVIPEGDLEVQRATNLSGARPMDASVLLSVALAVVSVLCL